MNPKDAGCAWSPSRRNAWFCCRIFLMIRLPPRSTPAKTAPDAASASIAARSQAQLPSIAWRHHRKRLWFQQEAVMRQICKGNVAIVKGAILAGCRSFYGYPITPASEIAEAAALYIPQVGGTFLQAESAVAAIHILYRA